MIMMIQHDHHQRLTLMTPAKECTSPPSAPHPTVFARSPHQQTRLQHSEQSPTHQAKQVSLSLRDLRAASCTVKIVHKQTKDRIACHGKGQRLCWGCWCNSQPGHCTCTNWQLATGNRQLATGLQVVVCLVHAVPKGTEDQVSFRDYHEYHKQS